MLAEPTCYTRKCKHYLGIIQPDGTELSETNSCSAFLQGIPDEIAYGDNLHLETCCGQENEIVYEETSQQAQQTYQVYRVPQE